MGNARIRLVLKWWKVWSGWLNFLHKLAQRYARLGGGKEQVQEWLKTLTSETRVDDYGSYLELRIPSAQVKGIELY